MANANFLKTEELRAVARRTMLPWNLTQERARELRLALHQVAGRFERMERQIDSWGKAHSIAPEALDELKAGLVHGGWKE